MDEIKRQAIELYDRFTHADPENAMDRRDFFAQMTRIAGGAAAANLLIGSIGASPAAAALTSPTDKRLRTTTSGLLGNNGHALYTAYIAEPRARRARRQTVIVIHENRGLNEHIRDVTRRLALAGFYAIAPDMLSPSGGTPAIEDAARDAIANLDLGTATAAGVAMVDLLAARKGGTGKAGIVGFCWGGAFVNRVAVAAPAGLGGGVAYYGTAPNPAEAIKVQAPLLLQYAALDTRVAATGHPWAAALSAAGKPVTAYNYPGVDHAFNNDTSKERFNQEAADLAWSHTLNFLRANLG